MKLLTNMFGARYVCQVLNYYNYWYKFERDCKFNVKKYLSYVK